MRLDDALTELLLAKDYSKASATRRSEVLREFIAWATSEGVTTTEEVTRATFRRYVAHLRDRPNVRYGGKLAGETQHSRASILRMFLRFCAREGWLDERMTAHLDMPRIPHKVVQVFTQEQYTRLIRATEGPLALRDRAILAVLIDTGLRSAELCAITHDAVSLTPHEAYIRVEGKGRRQREVGIGKQSTLALHRYLTRTRPKSESPLVFLSRAARPLTPNAIDRMLYRLRRVAGQEHFAGLRVSAHTIRHSFAVHYMEQGGDVYKLSRLLGHENITTTERYLRAFQAKMARRGPSVADQFLRATASGRVRQGPHQIE
jgi:site-specific recombinase XerD